MALKLFIVEDEQTIREGILSMIDWERHQIDVCGEAANGREALPLLERHRPDVLLTDIRMPYMDGLQLIEEAQRAGLDFRAIVLSGYNEFSYAKQALKLGVLDYILKPCRPDDILKIVLEAKLAIESEQSANFDRNKRDQAWNRNMHLLKNQVLSQWIHYPKIPLERREGLIAELQMAIVPVMLQVGLIRFDTTRFSPNYGEPDWELIRYAALNIVLETLAPVYRGKIEAFRDGDDLLWIANATLAEASAGETGTGADEELKSNLGLLQRNLEIYLNLSVSIAVGTCRESVDDAHISYREALQAMNVRFYRSKGGIFLYNETARKEGEQEEGTILDDEAFDRLEREIVMQMRGAAYEQALDKMERWLERFQTAPRYGKHEINVRATAFILELQRLAEEKNATTFEWKQHLVNWMEQIPQVETLDELSTIMKKIMQSLVEALCRQRSLHRTVQLAVDLIREKYNTNLTLDAVARAAYVSNTYLSSLFKQELGINFLDYLHQYRIEKAKELLAQNLKMFAVAKLVGYQEERHFSATFKKWTGLTPSQYQKGLQ